MTQVKVLELFFKKKNFVQFIRMLKIDRQQAHFKAIQKKTKYIYCMKLFAKSFEALKQNTLLQTKINEKIYEMNSIKNQSLIEQVFIEWRAYSKLNQEHK